MLPALVLAHRSLVLLQEEAELGRSKGFFVLAQVLVYLREGFLLHLFFFLLLLYVLVVSDFEYWSKDATTGSFLILSLRAISGTMLVSGFVNSR